MGVYIVNFNGEKEVFSWKKVYNSARRVGASPELAQKIAQTIQKELYPGIRTSEIFQKVKKLLHQQAPASAIKFNLKEGIKKLGPTGFHFEKYIGAIFSNQGFKVALNLHLPGRCISHETDFVAKKGGLFYIGECKYRNLPGETVHSKDAFATYGRFLDIKNGFFSRDKSSKNLEIKGILVTNTKFTEDAVKYSECMGIELLGWNHPKKKGLAFLIDSQKLYPITVLPSLRNDLAEIFVSQKIVLVQELLKENPFKLARRFKLPEKRLEPLFREARILLGQM